jgi:A/G-specific adenine glycosylase
MSGYGILAFMENVSHLHQKLFAWWQKEGRVLPWRRREVAHQEMNAENQTVQFLRDKAFQSYFAGHLLRDPYRVVVSEMMLQQTQVDRVLPKYEAWMDKWPTMSDLAQASLVEVLIFWQGLGYNRRARFLWLLAKEITEKRQGVWPSTEEELLKLPGIGKYTARAVMSFALGKQVGVVDTNVKRIFLRVFAGDLHTEKDFFKLADEILPLHQSDPWNQALMDFGALMCTAKNPKCAECPLKNDCSVNLHAMAQGYANYAEQLKTEIQASRKTDVNKPKKIRFEDTDRFFRGRIVDELRNGEAKIKNLEKILEERYGLDDGDRFQRLIEGLQKEGILTVHGRVASLG